jgi:hypothetical protein
MIFPSLPVYRVRATALAFLSHLRRIFFHPCRERPAKPAMERARNSKHLRIFVSPLNFAGAGTLRKRIGEPRRLCRHRRDGQVARVLRPRYPLGAAHQDARNCPRNPLSRGGKGRVKSAKRLPSWLEPVGPSFPDSITGTSGTIEAMETIERSPDLRIPLTQPS